MAIIKGHDLMLFVNGTSIGFATSHSLEITVDTTEISHKDIFHDWKASMSQAKSWTASTENLYATDNNVGATYSTLFDAMSEGNEVELVFAQKAVVNNPKEDAPFVPSYPMLKGKGIITALSINAPDGDNATFTCSFTGTGELVHIVTPPTATDKSAKISGKSNEKEVAK